MYYLKKVNVSKKPNFIIIWLHFSKKQKHFAKVLVKGFVKDLRDAVMNLALKV